LVAVWNEVLAAPTPVVSIFKTFHLTTAESRPNYGQGEDQPTSKADAVDHRKASTGAKAKEAGTKVDVVADGGREWFRVSTLVSLSTFETICSKKYPFHRRTKNSRLLAEFREIDSYFTDSDSDSDDPPLDVGRPTLAQAQFDNSILRMGRALVEAARANLVHVASEGTEITMMPRVTMRLTRLDPKALNEDGTPVDGRIGKTVEMLKEMGLIVKLGELPLRFPDPQPEPRHDQPRPLLPTLNINLDLSMLIALISDLTHAPLPASVDDAKRRFIPPPEYREWKEKRKAVSEKPAKRRSGTKATVIIPPGQESNVDELPHDLIKHSRALTNQLLQEMSHSMMEEVEERIRAASYAAATPGKDSNGSQKVTFWTTLEAKDRCLRIVSKIGGVHEKRRARALFCLAELGQAGHKQAGETLVDVKEAEENYWAGSRFPIGFIPLHPIRIFPTPTPPTLTRVVDDGKELLDSIQLHKIPFFRRLEQTCVSILSQDVVPHRRAKAHLPAYSSQSTLPTTTNTPNPDNSGTSLRDNLHADEIQRAAVTKANPKLTAHTVQTLQWGSTLGWTTLTANRSSIKAIVREVRKRIPSRDSAGDVGIAGVDLHGSANDNPPDTTMAVWIMSPRSLAEGMSAQTL